MRYTEKVRALGIRPELMLVLIAVQEIEHDLLLEVWVTSFVNGRHRHESSHYLGCAVDVDDVGDRNDLLATELESRLPPDYDVINEGSHVHIQFEPKEAMNA